MTGDKKLHPKQSNRSYLKDDVAIGDIQGRIQGTKKPARKRVQKPQKSVSSQSNTSSRERKKETKDKKRKREGDYPPDIQYYYHSATSSY